MFQNYFTWIIGDICIELPINENKEDYSWKTRIWIYCSKYYYIT